MSSRKVVKKIALVVCHHEYNSCEFLVEVLRQILGYEHSQAGNCANIIYEKGSYQVKTFKFSEMDKVMVYKDLFEENGVPVKIIPL